MGSVILQVFVHEKSRAPEHVKRDPHVFDLVLFLHPKKYLTYGGGKFALLFGSGNGPGRSPGKPKREKWFSPKGSAPHGDPRPEILSPWRRRLSLPIPCHEHWPRSCCRSRARAYAKRLVSGDLVGAYRDVCVRVVPACGVRGCDVGARRGPGERHGCV
jgi:hypothetical protein